MNCLDVFGYCPYTLDMKKPKIPRKAPEAVKTEYIELRVEQGEKKSFRDAADAAGMPMSGWIRDRLRRAARKELEDLDIPVAFLERLSA